MNATFIQPALRPGRGLFLEVLTRATTRRSVIPILEETLPTTPITARAEPAPCAPTHWQLPIRLPTLPPTTGRLQRAWSAKDVVTLDLDIQPRRVWADVRIAATAGQVGLNRGPVLHCFEGVDHSRRSPPWSFRATPR